MASESEYTYVLFQDIQNMQDDNIVDEIAYYLYGPGRETYGESEYGKYN